MYIQMKFYIENYTIDLLRSRLSKFTVTKTFVKRLFYSEEGVYSVDHADIYKHAVVDVPVTRSDVDGYTVIQDDSYINKIPVSQIPFDAVEVNISVTQYNNHLIVERINDRTVDFYFTSINNELVSQLN